MAMKSRLKLPVGVSLFIVFLLPISLQAELRMANIFGNNMVLQRDEPIHVWGWSNPGSRIQVGLGAHVNITSADTSGKWTVSIAALPAGGPYTLTVVGENSLEYSNVMVGELWICSGQSNMGMKVGGSSRVLNYKAEIESANYPEIRLLTVERDMSATPLTDVQTKGWVVCSPETVENFSATAYFFGRYLYEELDGIPIGLIHTSWGGTKIKAWTSVEALSKENLFLDEINRVKSSSTEQDDSILQGYKEDVLEWKSRIDRAANDLEGELHKALTDASNDSWSSMDIPNYWETQPALKQYDGIIWFKRLINIPETWTRKILQLSMGTIDDYDWTFINGQKIGHNGSRSRPSEYQISPQQFQTGENTLSIRVLDVNRRGGLWGRPQDQYLTPIDGGDTLWLSGQWNYKPVLNTKEKDLAPPRRPYLHNRPTVLYNAMLAPLLPLTFRGVIWYQGESNISQAHLYRQTFPIMIEDWREATQKTFPFLYVQLPNWGPRVESLGEAPIAELRDAQSAAQSLPKTAMAVTLDIGDERDIHPKNKQEVGRRLALLALQDVYHREDILAVGPRYLDHKFQFGRTIVTFSHIGEGLITGDGRAPVGFSVAGKDGIFYSAKAKIRGDRIILNTWRVLRPVAVRYAWAANPDINLTNTSGLPTAPFKTDHWLDSTQ